MQKNRFYLFLVFPLLLLVVNCAKRGSPTGGAKDEDPPVFVSADPPNYSINFKGDEIRIYFDELIKLKNIQKQLIISPPMKIRPTISPAGSAARFVTIKILDTLLQNTTYQFNFGNSVVDNNESNPFPFFKYVISTGDYIDSLSLKGIVRNALERETDDQVTLMLYEIDSAYTDSIVFRDMPRYVSSTTDSTSFFDFTNLKAGRYKLVALKDENTNYTYQPASEKIGFVNEIIELPTDEVYALRIFDKKPDPALGRPRYRAEQRITFPLEGELDSVSLELISEVPDGFVSLVTLPAAKDTVNYWFRPKLNNDSLVFVTKSPLKIDTFSLRKRKPPLDSLVVNVLTRNVLKLGDSVKIATSIPIEKFNKSLVTLTRKDSSAVEFSSHLKPKISQVYLGFETEENESYKFTLLPEAITDFYGNVNDTIVFSLNTKSIDDYSDFELRLNRIGTNPYIVQLVNAKNEMSRQIIGEPGQDTFTFSIVEPGKYYARIIEDANHNGLYDAGDFLKGQQPEKVDYYPEEIDVRTGWFPKYTYLIGDSTIKDVEENDPDLPKN